MSETSAAIAHSSASPDAQLEQKIYMISPFGTLVTTAILFAILFGSFLAVAAVSDLSTITRAANGLSFSQAAWPALVLSLLCSAALGMQRYARVREAMEATAYARILTGGMASASDLTGLIPRGVKLGRATLIGVGLGLLISGAIRMSETGEGHPIPLGPMFWFALTTILLNVLFVRGVEQTRAGSQRYASLLRDELKIDLLRTDTLSVLGRSAARSALIWFVVSAVACLFFVGGDLNWLTILLIVSCAAMGIGMFVTVMNRIHHQIVAAKDLELEHVRRQIDSMRAAMNQDDHASMRMHGLLAYEKRISEAPEWPFDQSTLVRVGASALILTVPWFGQAIAAYVVDHLSHIAS
jgi:hypothetical protein